MSRKREDICVEKSLDNFIDACVNNMHLFDNFSKEESEKQILGMSRNNVTSNQFINNNSWKIKKETYSSDQENEPYEIRSETEEQFTKKEDLCVACGFISANEFFSFPSNVDIRQQWGQFCDLDLDKIEPYFRLCDGHFKPEDYRISMQRKVLMPTSVPTLLPKLTHNLTPSISKNFRSSTDFTEFSQPTLDKNKSQNPICSSDVQRNTTTDASNKRFRRKFKDITNHNVVPPKAVKLTSKKNSNLGKCRLLGKNFRTEIFRLKIRCSRLEDTVTNLRKEIKQQVEECFVTRGKTAENVARDIQNLTSINASSNNLRQNFCKTEARTDQCSVEDAPVKSTEQVTDEDGYTTVSNMPPLEISSNDLHNVEVKPELFSEEVILVESAEKVAEDNHSVKSTISRLEISPEVLHNVEVKVEQFYEEVFSAVSPETSRNVTNNEVVRGISISPQTNCQLRRNDTAASSNYEQFAKAHVGQTLRMEPVQVTTQQPNCNDELNRNGQPSSAAGCSKRRKNGGKGQITRAPKKKKELPNVATTIQTSDSFPKKVRRGLMRDSPPYSCCVCEKIFHVESEWIRHESEHTKPFVCPKCKKPFARKHYLVAHQTTHSENRPYKCGICGSRFKHNYAKLKHDRYKHTDVAYFECAACGKMFNYKNSLIIHLRIHAGVKPFICQTCGRSFAQKGQLNKHQQNVHRKIEIFQNAPYAISWGNV
ncbi:uncharacterized protein LOC135836772 isoform X2 [Planococcus citri]|uniref:uncharacterized protein LOC135836772 isoform X2 n=1 Tax=Planococcus citri TaxID=170843 RepID=UPI0031F8DD70